jgi:hypothetical protein
MICNCIVIYIYVVSFCLCIYIRTLSPYSLFVDVCLQIPLTSPTIGVSHVCALLCLFCIHICIHISLTSKHLMGLYFGVRMGHNPRGRAFQSNLQTTHKTHTYVRVYSVRCTFTHHLTLTHTRIQYTYMMFFM